MVAMANRRERRVREALLKRELILRLQAESSDAPGQSGQPTKYFLRERKRLLARHPYFALRYELAKRWKRAGNRRKSAARNRVAADQQTS
jgi:hypothetical protein